MSAYLEQCIQAAALARKGKTHLEVKEALGFRYAAEAQRAINVGMMHDRAAEMALTTEEARLLLAVANAERANWASGDTCAPKLKYLRLWPWRRGKIERVARKRLDMARKGEENLPACQQTGLGLLSAYHGGFVKLRPAGWAVVHALEAKGGAA